MFKTANILVIIRSVNERTVDVCHQLMGKVIPQNQLKVIVENPFSLAIKKSFELAIQSNSDWLACVDADVLISAKQTKEFFERADKVEPHIFCVQSLILDKFFPIFRPSGIHLYRTALCERALTAIPKEGESLRPESAMKEVMARAGHPTQQSNVVVGIHDYEQYYCDIYRKCFLQAHKHSRNINDVLPYWQKMASVDFDFKIALDAVADGQNYKREVFVDKRFLKTEIDATLRKQGIIEKTALGKDIFVDPEVIIQNYLMNPFESLQQKMYPKTRWSELIDKNYLIKNTAKKKSLAKRIKTKIYTGLYLIKSSFGSPK